MQVFQIHLIEDCDADFVSFRRAVHWAMRELGAEAQVRRYRSASQAFTSLLDGAVPDLLFVDINLQGESGVAFLRRVKSEKGISPCPKIILTTSNCASDVENSFNQGAAGYLVKPLEFFQLREAVRVCLEYWFFASRRPPLSSHRSPGEAPLPKC